MPGSSMNGIRDKNIFLSFSAYLIPFSLKNNTGKTFFLFFEFFGNFFRNFLALVEYEQNSGLQFFSLCPGLSHPVLVKNNAGKRLFNFFNFFPIFFGIFFPGSSFSEIRD